ncbi:hypothetical protein BDV29DRAFT_154390 [Aspergillus leporis]|uniref:Uncharacterized protein n=1 Tax=Aspergillus leporis TaxID=41062 RepID=A0A5N5XBA4_9EURO|nr:hypothetical protein BDV29DRAFT_154390 [Aspergillus leporis]
MPNDALMLKSFPSILGSDTTSVPNTSPVSDLTPFQTINKATVDPKPAPSADPRTIPTVAGPKAGPILTPFRAVSTPDPLITPPSTTVKNKAGKIFNINFAGRRVAEAELESSPKRAKTTELSNLIIADRLNQYESSTTHRCYNILGEK